ncbi:hypothetical protein RRG08_023075 [Elysia crispata]|uniref:Uncharacterized protein n=1 Tax=Elysia crispata TaxID=231223 RepID=A0AAE1ARN8_9GAST|nr:hypothetical protein RRG08_023075 [Elysia crispata]
MKGMMTAQSVRARAQKKRICFPNKPPGRSSAKNPRYDARKRPTAKGSTMVLHNHNGRRGPNAPLNLFRRGGDTLSVVTSPAAVAYHGMRLDTSH